MNRCHSEEERRREMKLEMEGREEGKKDLRGRPGLALGREAIVIGPPSSSSSSNSSSLSGKSEIPMNALPVRTSA